MSDGLKNHGGARPGSGRKQTLDYLSNLHVGARAHNLQAKIAERRALRRHKKAMVEHGVTAAQEKARGLLRNEGPAHWESSYEGDETRDEIEFGLAGYHGDLEMENPPRLITLTTSTYGTLDYVLAVISRWASWYYGRPVPPDRVRKCLIAYRAFLRES